MPGQGSQSGLIVEIPEAEPVVRQYRERLDAGAALGVPAHVTVLFPFMPPPEIDAAVLTRLSALFAAVPGFDFRLSRTDWFDDAVLWLAPDDPGPFRALTRRVFAAFPAYPPYGGEFDGSVPHLTVGHGHPRGDLRAVEEPVRARLPVAGHARTVSLLTEQSAGGQWTRAASFPLG
jgi:hypothetical protein